MADERSITVEKHMWWDGRMSFTNNLLWNYWLPLGCLIRGHQFIEWFDYPNRGVEEAWCETCMKTGTRSL